MDGNVESGGNGGIDSEKVRRRHANHDEGNVVDQDGLSDGRRCAPEARQTEAEARRKNGRRSRKIILGSQEPPGRPRTSPNPRK